MSDQTELLLGAMLDLDHPIKSEAAAWASTTLGGRSDAFDRARWQLAADRGLLGLRVPEALGGTGASTIEALLTFEGLGLGSEDNGLIFALASQVFAMQTALLEAASKEQKARWLPKLCDGSAIGCFAMTEPEAGSDAGSITTTATVVDDGFVLDGEKCWVTLGPVADVAVVFASTDPERGTWGISAFLVPLDRPGITVGAEIPKGGLQACPFSTLRFDGCQVPADALLGGLGAGMAIFTSAVEAERAFLYASELGSMERIIDRSVDRARRRRQSGKAIGEFQAVSHRIAEMKLRHEAARLLVYKAAALHQQGRPVTMAAALAKLQTSEAAVSSALDAIRIHGAEGYTDALGLNAELGDTVGGLAYSGTSDIQRNIVARLLRADRPIRST